MLRSVSFLRVKPISERSGIMKTVRMAITREDLVSRSVGRIDPARVDATTEADLARQVAADEAEAMQDAARFARRVRRRLRSEERRVGKECRARVSQERDDQR